ncbi:MAG TPA: TetR/AcrR family transcriptional regulator [Kineosporiaceae bacterium]|nr:TetR/AcrR family transcriptional regulator [Kineosporiaceae bacterium]
MNTSTATRERILDAAMQLFGEHGFKGTSVAAIERAAGLTPGAGGLYHHFSSKDAVLTAGLERHVKKLGALRDIRRLFTGVGDLGIQLTLTARYVLTELSAESELLQVLFGEARRRPEMVQGAVSTLVASTYTEFEAWLVEDWAVPAERARSVSAVALGALFSQRLLTTIFPAGVSGLDDDAFVEAWVDTFRRALQS